MPQNKMSGRNSTARNYCKIAAGYADDVLAGRVPACRWVRLACERQQRDLARAAAGWEWKFDESRANRICAFVEKLPHIKGRWTSRNIVLGAWQCFILCVIFGWVDKDGFRRFRNALIVIPRKNGKTLIAAAVALYMLALDGEPGAEVYSAATTRDQAKIAWELAKKMVERTPRFRDRYGIEPLAQSISIESDAAWFKPLSRDHDSLEGLNPHAGIIDELHAHKTREVFDVLDEASGARSQPLKFVISTEGDQNTGVFVDQANYLQLILNQAHEDDQYFGIVFTCDEEDDWTSEFAWAKANPNLYVKDARGQAPLLADMQARCRRAIKDPASQSSFKIKRLNIRAGAAGAYFNMLSWTTICKQESLRPEQFIGAACVETIDLASKSDLTTKVTLFRGNGTVGEKGHYYVFGKYYLPEDAIIEGRPNYDFYRGWQQQGLLDITPGPRTDYEFLERDTIESHDAYGSIVGLDPGYNAEQFRQNLEKRGISVIETRHQVMTFSEPMKELAALILAGRVHHNGDPVLTWAFGNVVAKEDAKQNVYPRKARPENKIDPAVMAIAGMFVHLRLGDQHKTSMYDDPLTAVM